MDEKKLQEQANNWVTPSTVELVNWEVEIRRDDNTKTELRPYSVKGENYNEERKRESQ